MKPPIEYRPGVTFRQPKVDTREIAKAAQEAVEAYKANQRAKTLARVRKHRAKKKAQP